jgi:uncharacterized protein
MDTHRFSSLTPSLVLFGCLSLFAATARGEGPSRVDDRAGLFGEDAIRQADRIIAHIYRDTLPHKEVVVQTLPSLPAGEEANALARSTFQKRRIDGVLVLLVKQPHKLALTVGSQTEDRFPAADAERMRRSMIAGFSKGDYDGGLLAGLRFAETQLVAAFPRDQAMGAAGASETPVEQAHEHHASPLLWLLLLGGAALVVMALVRSGRRSSGPGGPSINSDGPGGLPGSRFPTYVGGGPGGSMGTPGGTPGATWGGGGGWGRSILGGIAGAAAGNWIYDRLVRDHGGSAGDLHPSAPPRGEDHDLGAPSSDQGDVGATFGGSGDGNDWGGDASDTADSGSSDIGGSDGGNDW